MNKKVDGTVRKRLETLETALISRKALLDKLIDPRRDYDAEAGYPKDITPQDYFTTYERLGLGHRVVECLPQESWSCDPMVYENEETDEETEFEQAVSTLEKSLNLWHYLARIDEVSGIGAFGILFLGLSDGGMLETPVPGVDLKTGGMIGSGGGETRLLFMRCFDESVVTVDQREADVKSPRYGQPTMYSVIFKEETTTTTEGAVRAIETQVTKQIHWTRVIHVADNRLTSEVYGVSRMKAVFDRLLDAKKLLAGAGEMFWRGAFPGLSFELMPGLESAAELDTESLKEQLELYQNGMQRYLSVLGLTVKSLAPQVADPSSQYNVILQDIALTLGIPMRVFLGTEEAKLASSQDMKTWNKRLARRQMKYLTPMLIRPFFDRLMAIGVLPRVEEYYVWWPDLNASSESERADIAVKRTQAFAQYVGGNVDQLIPPPEYLSLIHGMTSEEVEQITKASLEHQDDVDDRTPDEGSPGAPPGADVEEVDDEALAPDEIQDEDA